MQSNLELDYEILCQLTRGGKIKRRELLKRGREHEAFRRCGREAYFF